ncbi:LEA type 2 family protein [Methanocaldococcus sp.]
MRKALLILSIFFITSLSGCLEKPSFNLIGEEVKFLGNETIVDVKINISNPNPLGIKIDKIYFDIYALGNEKVKIGYAEKTNIQINPGDNIIDLPIKIDNGKLIEYFVKEKTTKVPIELDGEVKVNLLVTSIDVPITYKTEIDIGEIVKNYLEKEIKNKLPIQ